MGTCVLCGGKTSFLGTCKKCGLDNLNSKINEAGGIIGLVFSDEEKAVVFPIDAQYEDLKDFIVLNKSKVLFGIKKVLGKEIDMSEIEEIDKNERRKIIEERKNEWRKIKEKEKIEREMKMNEIGYFKGKMCPFTQVKIGGTKATTLALTGASMNEFTWIHTECIEEYCTLWDSKKKQCSIKSIAENFNKIKGK